MGGAFRGRIVGAVVGVSALSLALVTASASKAERSFLHPGAPTVHTPAPPPAPQIAAALPGIDSVVAAVRGVSAQATAGVLVWERVTGDTIASAGADQQFRSASVVKLLIAIDAMSVPDAATPVDAGTAARVQRMLRDSNDSAASALWDQRGGATLVSRTAQSVGLSGAAQPDIPGRWGNTLLTANDVLAVYQYLLATPPRGHAVLDALRGAPRVASDGFDQHFGIPAAFADQPWAIKQGWGNSSQDVFVHTTGLVGPGDRYVVVLLTSHPRGTAFRTAAAAVTAGATQLAGLLRNR